MINNIKILSTLGPKSFNKRIISQLDYVGIDIFRINLSHTPIDQLESLIQLVQNATNKPLCIDTEGAQVRTGVIPDDNMILKEQELIEIVFGDHAEKDKLPLRPKIIADKLVLGDLLSIDFTSVLLHIIKETKEGFIAKVVSGGVIRSNKAVSVDRSIELPPLTDKDIAAIEIAKKMGIDHYALSFANSKNHIQQLRDIAGTDCHIMAKVESKMALQNYNDILDAADAIIIDRGDLSREIPIEKIPFLQKKLIKEANNVKKPIYVATNLLESMVTDKLPSRAEVNDVVNTLLDGANGLVLAAETAIGNYPVNCANMIGSLIREVQAKTDYTFSDEIEEHITSSLLTPPHGGNLVNAYIQFNEEVATKIKHLPHFPTDEFIYLDADQIAMGTYSPINGFFNREELHSVLDNSRLPDGNVWTLPIVFQSEKSAVSQYLPGDEIVLVRNQTRVPYAFLEINDIYEFDFESIAKGWFGTTDMKHPGVARLKDNGDCFIGGKIKFIRKEIEKDQHLITPRQARMIFEHKGWFSVVAFHTRNVPHRAHEFLLRKTMEDTPCNGLFIQPVIGPKKSGDFQADIILGAYQILVENYFDPRQVVLGGFSTFSRYSGPREAVFTALCRQNYGCSHFIIGRDHTGVGKFYAQDASQRIFETLQDDIDISIVKFDEIYYCDQCQTHCSNCNHGKTSAKSISGSQLRKSIIDEQVLPDWFIRKEVLDFIIDQKRQGKEIYVK